MGHFITRCERCAVIISQCRCPAEDKKVIYLLCDVCKFEDLAKENEEKKFKN